MNWHSSEEESGNPDDGYNTDRCGQRGCSNWKDLKSKQPGGQTGRRLLEEMSNDEVRENREFNRERENVQEEQ